MKNKKQVSVYLNTKEYQYVQDEAKESEVAISEYIRHLILKKIALSEMNQKVQADVKKHDTLRY